MNTCYNCIDRHIEEGFGDELAIIYDSPVSQTIRKISYNELSILVNTFAGLLVENGIKCGDRVIIYMPNSAEAAIAMLACARLGAIHSVVFGGFAAHELATRIRDCTPSMIICSSCGIDASKIIEYKPLVDAAIELAADSHRVEKCIVWQREQKLAEMIPGRDIDWAEGVSAVKSPVKDCTPVDSTHPLYILYTSGTTGQPKGKHSYTQRDLYFMCARKLIVGYELLLSHCRSGVLRDNGGHAVALRYTMNSVYGMKPGDVFWAAR